MKKLIFFILIIVSGTFAQTKDSLAIAKEKKLRIINATQPDKKNTANYNLGNSQYANKKFDEAKINYTVNTNKTIDKKERQKNYHNLGNTYMKEKNYEKAVESYKNALKNNPSDEETRYNLALAKELLKQNPPKPKKKKNKKNNKNKKEDKNKDKKEPQNPEPKKQPSGEKKQQIDNVLNAISKAEKATQEKVNLNKNNKQTITDEKDW